MPSVCVYCASSPYIPERYLELATAVGVMLAERGWTLVSGGGSQSMMGAVARAARAGGSQTIGVIPRSLMEWEAADRDADELVVTEDMRERKGVMDARADAFLCLPGGIGTLEELMEVWTSRHLGMHDKPIAVLDPWGDFDLMRQQVQHWREMGFVHEHAMAQVAWTTTVDESAAIIAAAWATGA